MWVNEHVHHKHKLVRRRTLIFLLSQNGFEFLILNKFANLIFVRKDITIYELRDNITVKVMSNTYDLLLLSILQ